MEERTLFDYVSFGARFALLLREPGGRRISKFVADVGNMLADLEGLSLRVSVRAAHKIPELLDELLALPEDTKLSAAQTRRFIDLMNRLNPTVAAETKTIRLFQVSAKRIDTVRLLGDVSGLFGNGVYSRMPGVAQHDFAEAGKCIAFNRATAAAFHTLRGTEDVLRQYYQSIVKRKRLKVLLWFPMVDALRKRRNGPPSALLDHLDNIRVNFRNPTQHPEKIYTLDEAQDLFLLCIEAVNRMCAA